MKLKKISAYSSKRQIWRLLISDTNKLLIEERDTVQKEAFFNLVDIASGKVLWKDFQLDEKFWVGVEALYKDVIIFHKFGKPDMPSHKEIIVHRISDGALIWKTDNYEYLFVHNDKIYCRIQGFEKHKFIALDYLTGNIIDDIGEDYLTVNEKKFEADSIDKFAGYVYAEDYNYAENLTEKSKKTINKILVQYEAVGKIEAIKINDLLMFNFHYKNKNDRLTNRFWVIDELKGKELFNEILIEETNAFVPDSFFIKDDFLFLLKEKKYILTYLIIK